jgi:hypothetical protein
MPTSVLDLTYVQDSPSAMDRAPVIGWNTDMPQVGQWVAGDIIYNSAPTVGRPTGWVCLTSGCPGLWTTLPESV